MSRAYPLLLVIITATLLTSSVFPVYAQIDSGFNKVDEFKKDAGVKQEGGVGDLILSVNKIISYISVLIAFFAIIWGGVTYMISIGDDQKTALAKKTILYATIGLVVIGLAGMIVNAVVNLVVSTD
jgi:hypothetical protein